jgi:hypothetical protein
MAARCAVSRLAVLGCLALGTSIWAQEAPAPGRAQAGWDAWIPCVWRGTLTGFGENETLELLVTLSTSQEYPDVVAGLAFLASGEHAWVTRLNGVLTDGGGTAVVDGAQALESEITDRMGCIMRHSEWGVFPYFRVSRPDFGAPDEPPVAPRFDEGPRCGLVLQCGRGGVLTGRAYATDGEWEPMGTVEAEAAAPGPLDDEAIVARLRELGSPAVAALLDALDLERKSARKAEDVRALNEASWLYENDTGVVAQSVADLTADQGKGPAGYCGPYLRGTPVDPFTGKPYELKDGTVVGPGDVTTFLN